MCFFFFAWGQVEAELRKALTLVNEATAKADALRRDIKMVSGEGKAYYKR